MSTAESTDDDQRHRHPRTGHQSVTCASCANRIERNLNTLDGVTATVNYATEKAYVSFPAGLSPEDLVTTVEQAGYRAALPRARGCRRSRLR